MAADPGVLERIALHVEKRLARLKRERPAEALAQEPLYARKPRPFAEALQGPGPRVIAEVKFASPSAGFLREEKDSAEAAVRVASGYLAAGAAALSVLTERNHFAGSPDYLAAARRAHPDAFLLMKDFMIDPYQFELARAIGADCVLLIVALSKGALRGQLELARKLGLSALVEVHAKDEMDAALAAGAELIGVNNRDLNTLKTDLQTSRDLASLGRRATLVAESGLTSRKELDELAALGYKGFLIGTTFMRQPDPGAALKALLA